MKNNLIRITTVPVSLDKLLEGQLSFMKQHYEVTAISSDHAALEKVGRKEGVNVFCVEMTRKITPLKDIKSTWGLYKFFRKNKPLIVHTHTPKAGTVGMLAAWLANVPHRLHTVAGLPLLEATGNKRRLLNIVERFTYRFATRVYPNSNRLKDIIVSEKLSNPKKLKVIANGSSNGINTSYFDPALYTNEDRTALKAKLGIKPEDTVFIFVGRLVGDKGINELIDAFDRICEQYLEAKLLLVGPFESELDPLHESSLQIIDTNKNIISMGWQSDVRPYFSISDILVFPSYREGFPNVVMQAGSMGLASIVTDINGCNEIIIENKNGTIIPVKNTEAIFKAMEMYLKDKKFVSELRSNARNMIVSRYEQGIVWEALLNEYRILESQIKHV